MWQPSASIQTLRQRAQALAAIRAFFHTRGVLEVETPLLCAAVTTDPHLQPMSLTTLGQKRYLQTSPEFAMKRLLAAGMGPCYQLCKAFREGESGGRHNPEFTMLEWYQPGWDDEALMEEVDAFFQAILDCPPAKTTTYAALFYETFELNPHQASDEALQALVPKSLALTHRNDCLDYLFSHAIEPTLGHDAPLIVKHYPATQAALANVQEEEEGAVAKRFEVYVQGMELANGYDELTDPQVLRKRFEEDNKLRTQEGRPTIPIDEHLLAAMTSGLPKCAGVALGVDRLIQLKLGLETIAQVLSFDSVRA